MGAKARTSSSMHEELGLGHEGAPGGLYPEPLASLSLHATREVAATGRLGLWWDQGLSVSQCVTEPGRRPGARRGGLSRGPVSGGRAAVVRGQAPHPLVDSHDRAPVQIATRGPLIEPVRGR